MRSDNEPGPSRAAMTRRVLLAAGGLVLLGELVAGEGSGAASRQSHGPQAMREEASLPHASASPDVRPNARPMVSRQQAEPDKAAAGQPARSSHEAASGGQPAHEAVPRERRPPPANGQPIYTVDDGPNVIALTSTTAPVPPYTPQVLRLLNSYGITASFSMVGRNVAAYPSLAREVVRPATSSLITPGHMPASRCWRRSRWRTR